MKKLACLSFSTLLSVFFATTWAKEQPLKHEVESFEREKLQAETGDRLAQYFLGLKYFVGAGVAKDHEQSFSWFQKSANQGFEGAQYEVGVCYQYGYGVSKDEAAAIIWYRKAAQQGDVVAFCKLGECSFSGIGVAQDYDQAIYWFRRAAELGNATAQRKLGDCYSKGLGVTRSEFVAQTWYYRSFAYFRKMEESAGSGPGLAATRYMIGMHFEEGLGVPVNLVEAYAYYQIANANDKRASLALVRLNNVLSKDQLAAAQKRTSEILKVITPKTSLPNGDK